jgi:hypothetical protein
MKLFTLRQALKNDARYKIQGHVSWSTIEGQVVVVDEAEGKIFRLNKVASEIWKLLDGSMLLGDVIHEVEKKFEAPEHRIRKDALSLLKQLQREDLVREIK